MPSFMTREIPEVIRGIEKKNARPFKLESQQDFLKEQSSGSSKPKVQLSVTNEVGNSETATAGQAEVETVSNEKSSGYLIRWDDMNNEVEEVPEYLPPLPE